MLRVDKVEVYSWVGEDVIRIRGDNKGRRAKVLDIGERGGRIAMTIKYYNGRRTYYCSPFNFALSRHWKEKPYKPKPENIQKFKELFTEERCIEIREEQYFPFYVPILYDSINPRILRYLIDQGFLEKSGRLARVLRARGLSWEEYREQKASEGLPWCEANVFVYRIIKDIF